MKKTRIITLCVCLLMMLVSLPSVVLTAEAVGEEEGMWTTNRQADEYGDDVEIYRPEAGYHYDSSGFVTDTEGCYDHTSPFLNVQTKEPQNMKEGFFMEVRIDDFSYRGLDGIQDEWVSFNIWTEDTVAPFLVGYGEGWLTLLRSAGKGGNAAVERWFTTDEQGFHYNPDGGHGPNVTPRVNLRNQELWTFNVTWDEVNGYTVLVNGTAIDGGKALNELLDSLNPDGRFYVGVCLHSTEWEGAADLAITRVGTSESTAVKPTGSDSKEPEENPNREYECADPDTVPENSPALLWNADMESFLRDPSKCSSNLIFTPQGDKSYAVYSPGGYTAYTWTMKQELSYDGYDFPWLVLLVKNLWCGAGNVYHCTGDLMFPNEGNKGVWQQYHSSSVFYTDEDGDEYSLMFLKLNMTGRINSVRVQFDQLDQSTEETRSFGIMYMGFFRSMEEAQIYTDTEYGYLLAEGEENTGTDTNTDTDTDIDTDTETETENKDTETTVDTDTVADADADTDTQTETDASTESETAVSSKGGCGASLVGLSALTVAVAAAVAAAFVAKKKEE